MTKKPGPVWTYYNKKVDGAQTIAYCKYCNQSYIQNATRMERHLVKCEKCPESVKETFSKHRKDQSNVRVRKPGAWIDSKCVNAGEAAADWEENYEAENVNFEITGDMDMALEAEVAVPNVVGTEQQALNIEWEPINIKCSKSPMTATAEFSGLPVAEERPNTSQDRPSVSLPRKPALTRRFSQWPGVSARPTGYSPLQSKILQEQLLERRIWRRVAELELRKKNLELEKLQWEYERDKMQSEMKLGHESRMMELREEREKQMLEREMADG